MSLSSSIIRFFLAITLLASVTSSISSCTYVSAKEASSDDHVQGFSAALEAEGRAEDCPSNPPGCLKYALGKVREGNTKEASRVLGEMFESAPEEPWRSRVSFLLGRIALESGRSGSTNGTDPWVFFKAAEPAGQGEGLTHIGDYVLYYQAGALKEAGEYKPAAQAYGRLIEKYPDSILRPEAEYLRAMSLVDAGELKEARAGFTSYAVSYQGGEHVAEAILRSAKLSLELGESKGVGAVLKTLLVDYPATGAADEATRLLAGGWEGDVEVPELTYRERYIRAENLFAGARFDEAAGEFSALALDEKSNYRNSATIMKADSLVRLKRYSEAEKVLKRYLEKGGTPVKELDALYLRALVAARQGKRERLERIEARLAKVYSESDERAKVMLFIARNHKFGGDTIGAVRAYKKVVDDFKDTRGHWAVSEARWGIGWIYYDSGKYGDAYRVFTEELGPSYSGRGAARLLYWRGRSAENVGKPYEALESYKRLCRDSSNGYYCLMARERAKGLLELPDGEAHLAMASWEGVTDSGATTLLRKSPKPSKKFLSDRHYLAARELLILGLKAQAAGELELLAKRYSRDRGALIRLAKLFYIVGDYYRALRIYRNHLDGYTIILDGGEEGFIYRLTGEEFSFPSKLVGDITRLAPEEETDPYLVAAVIREESTFNPRAVSRTGAVGLMQIMPATGRFIAERIGYSPFSRDDLLDPETNIRFGAWYLGHLSKRFDKNVVLTVASYNAGPGAAEKWLKSLPPETDAFIESIPYPETRAYAKRVLRSYLGFLRNAGKEPGGVFSMPSPADERSSGGDDGGNGGKGQGGGRS